MIIVMINVYINRFKWSTSKMELQSSGVLIYIWNIQKETKLSTHIWDLKENEEENTIEWEIIAK